MPAWNRGSALGVERFELSYTSAFAITLVTGLFEDHFSGVNKGQQSKLATTDVATDHVNVQNCRCLHR